jgi:Uncharacterised protein family (UPF0158)
VNLDWEGLIVGFESRSALITHFLDRETGDVVQCVAEREPERHRELTASPRFLALPRDHGERGIGEMRLFLAELEDAALRARLESTLSAAEPAIAFRDSLRQDAREETRYFQFKHRRARERAQEWLASVGIPLPRSEEPVKAPRDFQRRS